MRVKFRQVCARILLATFRRQGPSTLLAVRSSDLQFILRYSVALLHLQRTSDTDLLLRVHARSS